MHPPTPAVLQGRDSDGMGGGGRMHYSSKQDTPGQCFEDCLHEFAREQFVWLK